MSDATVENRGGPCEIGIQGEIKRLVEDWPLDAVVAVEAEKMYLRFIEMAPEALDEWLKANARRILAAELGYQLGQYRNAARNGAPIAGFKDRAAQRAAGKEVAEPSPSRHFDATHVVAAGSVRRKAGDMTAADHIFVANTYTRDGNDLLMMAAFHKAVAKRVGDKKTSDVFTEDTYAAMLRGFTKKAA